MTSFRAFEQESPTDALANGGASKLTKNSASHGGACCIAPGPDRCSGAEGQALGDSREVLPQRLSVRHLIGFSVLRDAAPKPKTDQPNNPGAAIAFRTNLRHYHTNYDKLIKPLGREVLEDQVYYWAIRALLLFESLYLQVPLLGSS
jgi:hypothetical protein